MANALFLICGDDDQKLDAWRTRLRRRAEAAGGPGALELFDAPQRTPAEVAMSLAAMTLTADDRYLLVDGVDGWKAGDLEPLESELGAIPAGTILVLIARGKAPARLAKAVAAAGGDTREYASPKPWEIPHWTAERAREAGLNLDSEAAKALVAIVGPRQQRLASELEKLALMAHPRTGLTADEVRRLASGDSSEQAYDLADAIVAGDVRASMEIAERLCEAGERPSKLTFAIVRRLRDVHRVCEVLDSGMPEARAQTMLRLPPWAWKRTVAQAKKADREGLARALCAFADFEIELRGGGIGLDEESAFSLTLARAADARLGAAA